MNPTTSYQPYVILASGRTGSNLLRSLLSSHDDVVAYAEIFLQEHSWFEDPRGPADSPELIAERDADTVGFVKKHAFREYEPGVLAVGFKLFYRHAPQNKYRLWDWLNRQDQLRVIHLRRRNTFRQYLSFQVASATNVWRSNYTREAKMASDEVRVTIDPALCEKFLAEVANDAAAATARLSSRPTLDLTYEGLASDIPATMERVQRFLDLPPRPLETPLKKQVTRPLRDVITNYDKLARHFRNSPWASHFDE